MQRNKRIVFVIVGLTALSLACQLIAGGAEATPVPTSPEAATATLTAPALSPSAMPATSIPFPTRTAIPASTPNAYAASFGEPILAMVQDRQPSFEDDFSTDVGWTVHTDRSTFSLSFEGGFVQSLSDGNASYIHIQYEKFRNLQNFVMKVEAAFIESRNMPRDRAIGVCWWPGDELGERFLLYEVGEYLGGTCHDGECPDFVNGWVEPIAVEQFVSLILIHQRGESAVYVDGTPVAYHKLAIARPSGGFSLCPHTFDRKQTDIKYDNVKLWSLP